MYVDSGTRTGVVPLPPGPTALPGGAARLARLPGGNVQGSLPLRCSSNVAAVSRKGFGGLLALGLVLGVPGSSAAATQTFGSALATTPNATFGCELEPFLANSNGDFAFAPSGQPDCTWRQEGVFGSTTDSRFSSVPGDGRIVKVEVRSGPNPAPLRFVVLRQLGNTGATQDTQCCFFVSETAPVQLQPNAVSSFAVNIPVQRNTIQGIRAFDLMGISAASNTGSLPLLEVGPHNAFMVTTPGAVDAGYFYPRLGADPNDSGGGRHEQGISGIELTVRWTWQSANATPGAGGGGPGSGAPTLGSRLAAVRAGRALIALACGGNAACQGQLQLLAAGAGTATSGTKPITYGKARFAIPAGGNAKITVNLTGAAKRLLRKRARLTAVVRLIPTGGAATSSSITLRR
jgi:hypothetical protein